MWTDLTKVVVSITGSDPQRFGTGFAIYRDEHFTYLITCMHVVEQVGGTAGLMAGYKPATVVASDSTNGFDLAILRVEEELDLPTLKLSLAATPGSGFRTAGHLSFGGRRLIQTIEGYLDEQLQLDSDEFRSRSVVWFLTTKEGNLFEPGYSGAPVIDEEGNVFGVISHRLGKGSRGFAISIGVLKKIWLEMPASLLGMLDKHDLDVAHLHSLNDPVMNFEEELDAFRRIATNLDNKTRLIGIHGASGMGKSRLIGEYQRIADEANLSVLLLSLGPQISVYTCLTDIVFRFGMQHFPSFGQVCTHGRQEPFTRAKEEDWYKSLTWTLFADLSKYRDAPRLAIFFDQYEKADRSFREWLNNIFLPGIFTQPFIVVVAGQDKIERQPSWHGHRQFFLNGVTVDWYHRYAKERNANLDSKLIDEFHKLLRGCPKQFVDYVQSQLSKVSS